MSGIEAAFRAMADQGASVQEVADAAAVLGLPPPPVMVKLFAHQQEGYERALRCFGYEDAKPEAGREGGDP